MWTKYFCHIYSRVAKMLRTSSWNMTKLKDLQKALIPDPELETIVLSNKFTEFPERLLHVDVDNWSRFLVDQESAIVTKASEVIEIEFPDATSSVSFRIDNPGHSVAPIVVKVDLSTNQDTELSLCYRLDGTTGKSRGAQCGRRNVKKGENQVFFRIIRPGARGRLTISPAEAQNIMLGSIKAKYEELF